MRTLCIAFRILPYFFFAMLGFVAAKWLHPNVKPDREGAIIGGLAVLVGVITTWFMHARKKDNEMVTSKGITSREYIELQRVFNRRSVFLQNRWVVLMLSYFLIVIAGVLLPNINISENIEKYIFYICTSLFSMSLPTLWIFVRAYNDIEEFRREVNLREREAEDRSSFKINK